MAELGAGIDKLLSQIKELRKKRVKLPVKVTISSLDMARRFISILGPGESFSTNGVTVKRQRTTKGEPKKFVYIWRDGKVSRLATQWAAELLYEDRKKWSRKQLYWESK